MSDLSIQSANFVSSGLQIGSQAGLQMGSKTGLQIGTQSGIQSSFAPLATLRTLETQAASTSAAAPSPRLVKAAHEFEASMMKELLAPLQPGKDGLEGEDDDHDSNSALTEFASEALGKAISEHGGLGIAKRILQQLSARNHSGNAPVTAVGNAIAPNSSHK